MNRTNRRSLDLGSERISRRAFLRRSLAVSGLAALPQLMPAAAWGAAAAVAPSNRVTVALIGKGAMGGGHLERLAYDPAFEVLAVCDVDESRREQGRAQVDQIYAATRPAGTHSACIACRDYLELLARPDLDAVLIATPDHWHALQSIQAARAGKDIYCEKPVSVTLGEGRQLAQTVRRYGRVFQTGSQYRSIPAIRKVCQFIRDGRLGKVKTVFTLFGPLSGFLGAERFKPYAQVLNLDECGKEYYPMDFALPAEPVPAGLDWDRWVGAAPWRPYCRLYHANPSPGLVPWSFCDAFGAASTTWYLSHAADVIQWALGYENSGPVEIIHPGAGKYPTLTCRYANGTLLHMIEDWNWVKDVYHAVPANARLAGNFGGVFVGERGWVTTMSDGGRIEGDPESLFQEMALDRSHDVNIGSNNHHANWLDCIRTRQAPSADEEIGHRAASLGLLANLACKLSRSLTWDPIRERFTEDDAANRLLSRSMRAPWRA